MMRILAAIAVASGALLSPPVAGAAFPGANGKIAFQRQEPMQGGGVQDPKIFTMDPNGQNQIPLTTTVEGDFAAAYSPDGERIAFGRDTGADTEIFVIDADGQNELQLTNNAVDDKAPAFSADGRQIVFTSDVADDQIFIMDADGQNQRPLANVPGVDHGGPVFSPDGQKIAFSRSDGGDSEIFVMDASGQNALPLTSNGLVEDQPDYSPDGSRIAFRRELATGSEIFVMGANGQNQAPLTDAPTTDSTSPAFSPDGQRIAFHRFDGTLDDIWVMNADGDDERQLTDSIDGLPDWQPLNPPNCDLSGQAKQKSAKRIVLTVTCSEDAIVAAAGTMKAPKVRATQASASKAKQVALGSLTIEVQPSSPTALALSPATKKGVKLLKRAQKAGKKPKGEIAITAEDDLGATASDSFAVKLRKKKPKR